MFTLICGIYRTHTGKLAEKIKKEEEKKKTEPKHGKLFLRLVRTVLIIFGRQEHGRLETKNFQWLWCGTVPCNPIVL